MNKAGEPNLGDVATEPNLEVDSEILHELSQPLTAISNYASAGLRMSERSPASIQEIRQTFERIKDEAHRANLLCKKFRV